MNEFGKLLRFARPYRKTALFSFVALVIVVTCDLAVPRLVGHIIDQGIRQRDLHTVLSTSALMLGISALSALAAVLNSVYSIRVGEGIARDLRESIFIKIQNFSYGNVDQFSTAKLMVRLTSDTAAVQRLFQMSLRLGSRAPLSMIGSIALMFVTSKTLALTMMPIFIVGAVVIFFFSTKMEPFFRTVQQRLDRLNTVLQENIAGARLIKAFVRGKYETERFETANDNLAQENVKVMRIMASMSPILTMLINIGIIVVVWLGGLQSIQGDLTLGQIVAFTNYLMATLHPLISMTQLSNNWANGLASSKRIAEVLDAEPEVAELPNASSLPQTIRGEVEFDHVYFHYNGDTALKVLEDICTRAEARKVTAVLGATGSGKSSLVNLIPRFYDARSGKVNIDSNDVRLLRISSILEHIAIVPQETVLFSGTVRDNIRYGKPDASDEEVLAAAVAAHANDFIMDMPEHYETHIEERGANLSGGQKQRIAIARALITKPSILILDDATSAIDVETETKIHAAIAKATMGITLIMVAQRISTVLNADKIIVLDEGRIVAEGTHRELLKKSPIYKEIYDSQLGAGGASWLMRQVPRFRMCAPAFKGEGGRPTRYERASDPRKAMKRLFGYLMPFRQPLLLIVFFVLLQSLLGLVGPYLLGSAIDKSIGGKDINGLARNAVLMLIAYFLSNSFNLIANRKMAIISQNALKNLRRDLFVHIQWLPMRFFDTNPAGGLMSRLTNDIDAINQAVSQNIISLVAGVITMSGILVSMFVLNHWLALTSLIVIPIMYFFSNFVAKYTRKGFRELQKELGDLNAIAEETISGFKVIKAFRRNDSAIETFKRKNEAVYKAAIYANSYALLLMPLTGVIGSFFVILLASLGGWLALKDLVSIGMIATFINYAQNFTQPLRQISNLYNSIQAALAGAERVFEIIDMDPEIAEEPRLEEAKTNPETAIRVNEDSIIGSSTAPIVFSLGQFQGNVSFKNVVFGYLPGKPVIKNFDVDISAGLTVALVGPTGAGKTTITNLLMRFYEIDEGQILFDGVDIRTIPKEVVRRAIGLVLQDTFLFADSVLENIRFGRLDATDEECIEAAKMAEVDHFIRQLPEGYQTNLSERASNLSQGQRQLLSIARAILADPAILILDEATSSVDTRTEIRIQRALLRLMHGRTSIVIAHRLSTIRDADKIIVIDDGKIVEIGDHQALLAKRGFYHRLYMSQFKGNEI